MPMLTSMSDAKVPWPVRPHSFGALRTGRALVKLVGLGVWAAPRCKEHRKISIVMVNILGLMELIVNSWDFIVI